MAEPSTIDTTQITLFFLGSAVAVTVAAITIAGWKHKLLIWGLLLFAIILAALAFTWQQIAAQMPSLFNILTYLASPQTASFLAIMACIFTVVYARRRAAQIADVEDGSPPSLSLEQVNGMISQALSAQIATIKDDVTALRDQSKSLMTEFQQVNEIVSDLLAKDRAEYVREQIKKIDSDTAKLDAVLQAMIQRGSSDASFDKKTIDYKPPMRRLKENLGIYILYLAA